MLPSGLVVPSLIRRVQTGAVTVNAASASGTATITAVNVTSAFLVALGVTTTYAGSGTGDDRVSESQPRLELTNSTTVTATRDAGTNGTLTMGFVVLEFVPGVIRSLQRGTISLVNVASNTATITAVNVNKSIVVPGYWSLTVQSSDNVVFHRVELTNSTTVTAYRDTAGVITATVPYQVIEFF